MNDYSKSIVKISSDGINFYDIEGILDLKEKKFECNIKYQNMKEILGFDYGDLITNNPSIYAKHNYYAIDDNNMKYSCLDCIIGLKPINNGLESIFVYSTNITTIIENIISNDSNIKIKELIFSTTYPKNKGFETLINNVDFKYASSKKIYIRKEIKADNIKIDFDIKSNNECSYSNMSNILYSLLEMFFLMIGTIPQLDKIILIKENEKLYLYQKNAGKYIQKINSSNECIDIISNDTINSNNLKEFIKFRKDTKILFDMFLIDMNDNDYIEIRNSALIQLLEGLYKTIIKPNGKENLIEILHYYFKNNYPTNLILSKRDKKEIICKDANGKDVKEYIFIFKAKNHRNYLSHLNIKENKCVFVGLENNYANWKFSLCIRLSIICYLGIYYDKKRLNNLLKSIDNWAKNHKMRYKKQK